MRTDLVQVAKARGIQYFLVSYTDLFGVMRSKLVPARAIGEMQAAGAGFAGFATHLDMTPADPDMWAVPDPDSLIQLPWKPEVAWLASDVILAGAPVAHAPRVVLKRVLDRAEHLGYRFMTGVECEYFVISPDGAAIADPRDTQAKPCYDQMALLRRFDLIREIIDSMIQLGWAPYQVDHEDANGQFEMNWQYAVALTTADRHAFFKFMVKHLAEKHGLRATFMPKPFPQLTGSGCHVHFSLWNNAGKVNLFSDKKGALGLSALAYNFLGGLLHSADALCAIAAPTVNSYKRINAPVTASGATWSPNAITYAGNNRTHLVRIPEPNRFELRLADGAANPYLLPAALLAAGLDGIAHQRDPGKRLDINMYSEGANLRGVRRLPLNLLDALRIFERSTVLREGLGKDFTASYLKLKSAEWRDFAAHFTAWERERTLDC
ncbi:MAG: type III glutamate--ammonia ligase [Actinobacteria bacterium]|nr:type III glutamate--ammonia ligase [Actinomycetota bacterium]